ncbi:MAG: LemA family protein [Myxococcaceae bacterium]
MSWPEADVGHRPPRARGMGTGVVVALALAGLFVLVAVWFGGTYNTLVRLDQGVKAQWAQVENAYQRRLDLVPNLVETVKGAAAFERETFAQVAQARSQAGQFSGAAMAKLIEDPKAFERFQAAQDSLSSALSRLIAVSERYPELKATQNFRDLQAQLEGTENRIAVERMRFNEAARDFNSRRSSFPTVLVAAWFGSRFAEKPFFEARPGAETAPPVQF